MRNTATPVLLTALLLGVAGCTGGTDDPTTSTTVEPATPSSETTTPEATTDEPTTQAPPDLEPPTPGEGMDVDDHNGAIAAAIYFLQLYPYMRTTGDTATFEAMSGPDCKFCESSLTSTTTIHESGGWVDGGALSVDTETIVASYPTADQPYYAVQFTMTEGDAIVHDGDGTTRSSPEHSYVVLVALDYTTTGFVVLGVNFP